MRSFQVLRRRLQCCKPPGRPPARLHAVYELLQRGSLRPPTTCTQVFVKIENVIQHNDV